MIVVSNSSPLIALARIGHLNLLASLHNRILIPAEVHHEVTVAGQGLPGAEEVRNANWIEMVPQKSAADPSLVQACQDLGAGERGAILLAKSLRADLVLLDEWRARRIAREAGLSDVGCAAWTGSQSSKLAGISQERANAAKTTGAIGTLAIAPTQDSTGGNMRVRRVCGPP